MIHPTQHISFQVLFHGLSRSCYVTAYHPTGRMSRDLCKVCEWLENKPCNGDGHGQAYTALAKLTEKKKQKAKL